MPNESERPWLLPCQIQEKQEVTQRQPGLRPRKGFGMEGERALRVENQIATPNATRATTRSSKSCSEVVHGAYRRRTEALIAARSKKKRRRSTWTPSSSRWVTIAPSCTSNLKQRHQSTSKSDKTILHGGPPFGDSKFIDFGPGPLRSDVYKISPYSAPVPRLNSSIARPSQNSTRLGLKSTVTGVNPSDNGREVHSLTGATRNRPTFRAQVGCPSINW